MTQNFIMLPRFSIIIPHYNMPDLLMRCLKSIPVSEDIQVIVVDDNSPNADTYLEKYLELSRPYLEFIRTTKGGSAGYARNIGLDHAKGKWLLFADSDDFYVENMYDVIKIYANSDADVLFFRSKCVLSSDTTIESEKGNYINQKIDSYFKTRNDKEIKYRWGPPWGKMIRKDLISRNNIRFDEVRYANDHYFSVYVGCKARNIEVVDAFLYMYVDREGSLSSEFCLKPGELACRADVSFRVQKLLNEQKVQMDYFGLFMCEMLKKDRSLFNQYYWRLNEIYPSNRIAIQTIAKGRSIKLKLYLYIYSFLLNYIGK